MIILKLGGWKIMHDNNEELILHLKKSEKEYIEMTAKQKYLSIEQFLVLCALTFGKDLEHTQLLGPKG